MKGFPFVQALPERAFREAPSRMTALILLPGFRSRGRDAGHRDSRPSLNHKEAVEDRCCRGTSRKPTRPRRASACPLSPGMLANKRNPRPPLQVAADRSGPSRHSGDKTLANQSEQSDRWFGTVAFPAATPEIRVQRKSCAHLSEPHQPAARLGTVGRCRRPERSQTISNRAVGLTHTFREGGD